jgi:hypothetical protein
VVDGKFGLGISRWVRTKGPWEPAWVAEARRSYYAKRDTLDPIKWRIGATDAGREFLRRTGGYGLRYRRSGRERRGCWRGTPDRRGG